jgi:hypothetical protein
MSFDKRLLSLTEEQQAIIASRSEALRIVAFAGTGKTSTLRAYAAARPQHRMLYLAFNSAVAREAAASFQPHVTCSTIHALAYRALGHRYRHKLKGSLRAHQVAVALGLDPQSSSDLACSDRALAALLHFLSSRSTDLEAFRLEHQGRYRSEALAAGERLWVLMINPAERLPMLHDGYLKLYQLSAPRLEYDTILLDEAQDANPLALAILRQQSCARVFVGDPHQQIYQFRHATNAMAEPSLVDELVLSQSFRFGDEIAAAANRLLALKREHHQVVGVRSAPVPSSSAFIARGNAALYRRAVELARSNQRLHWCGGLAGYRLEQLLDLWRLRSGQRDQVRDPFLAGFRSFGHLASYCEEQDQRDLRGWINLIERHPNWEQIPDEVALVQQRSTEKFAPGVTCLATAHKSKGLEFGRVELAEDFHEHQLLHGPADEQMEWEYDRKQAPALWDEHGYRGGIVLPEEELNLRYVAVTRAQGSCRSQQWSAPLFEDLASFCKSYPRFVLVDRLSVLKPAKTNDSTGTEEQDGDASSEPPAKEELRQDLSEQGRRPDHLPIAAGQADKCKQGIIRAAEQPSEGSPQREPQASSSTHRWFLGSLDRAHLLIVTAHYQRKCPALDWERLLWDLAEQRLAVQDPGTAVGEYLKSQRLTSAQALIERFLMDVGLVVLEEPVVGPNDYPALRLVSGLRGPSY